MDDGKGVEIFKIIIINAKMTHTHTLDRRQLNNNKIWWNDFQYETEMTPIHITQRIDNINGYSVASHATQKP